MPSEHVVINAEGLRELCAYWEGQLRMQRPGYEWRFPGSSAVEDDDGNIVIADARA